MENIIIKVDLGIPNRQEYTNLMLSRVRFCPCFNYYYYYFQDCIGKSIAIVYVYHIATL